MSSDSISQYRSQFLQGQVSPEEMASRLIFSPNAKEVTALFLKSLIGVFETAAHPELYLKLITHIRGDSAATPEFQTFVTTLIQAGIFKSHSPELQTLFNNAYNAGNDALAAKIVDVGINLTEVNDVGLTPVQNACEDGKIELLSHMLKMPGSHIDVQDAIYYALTSRSEETVTLLIEHGASLAKPNAAGETVLHGAIQQDCPVSFCAFLIRAGAPLDTPNEEGITPLLSCIVEGRTAIAEALIRAGANVDLQADSGIYPLEIAQLAGNDEIASLFTHGIAFDRNLIATRDGYTARLSLTPPIPTEGINNPRSAQNSPKFEQFIQAHDAAIQPAIRDMVENTQHVSFAEFSTSFAAVVDHLNAQIPPGEEYIVLVEPQKSNKWLAELALPHLKQLPKDVVRMKDLESALKQNPNVARVVLFDDASYSGEQMSRFVRNNAVSGLEKSGRQDFTIHIAVPYLTEWAEGKLDAIHQECAAKGNGKVLLAPHQRMQSAVTQVAAQSIPVLTQAYFPASLAPNWAILNDEDMDLLFTDETKVILKQFGFDCGLLDSFHSLIESTQQQHPEMDQMSNEQALLLLAQNPQIEEHAKRIVDGLATFWKDNENKVGLHAFQTGKTPEFAAFIIMMTNDFSTLKENIAFEKGLESRTLTVFDHKVADNLSTCPGYEYGDVYENGETSDTSISKLFPGSPPYKTNYR